VLALALSTLFSACFGLVIRLAQGAGSNLVAVGAFNYLTAMAVNAAILAVGGGATALHASTIALALVGGVTYASAFFPVFALTRVRGASVTGAVMRISAIVPVGFSLLAWGERLTGLQTAGAAVAMVSLPLLTLGRPAGEAPDSRGRGRGTLLAVGLFAMNGLCLLVPRAFHQTGVVGEDAAFLSILFAAAAATACAVWAVSEHRIRAGGPPPARHSLLLDAVPGIVIGTCNALQNRFIVLALERLPGTVVYPFYSAVGLLAVVVVSRLAWRERFGLGGAVGLALAAASVVLVNLA
jgi:multidrug transporter EmrE-like cation transporter